MAAKEAGNIRGVSRRCRKGAAVCCGLQAQRLEKRDNNGLLHVWAADVWPLKAPPLGSLAITKRRERRDV